MIGNFLTNQMRTFWILEKSAGIDTNDDIDCLTFFTNVPTTLELPNVRTYICHRISSNGIFYEPRTVQTVSLVN